jgi:DNA-binding LytR/AlgR family response regulator
MLNCIAIDDEKWVLDLLVDNIQKVPFLHLIGRCKNALEAADVLHREKIDLLFIDIQMPGLSGLQFLGSLPHPPMAIFVTAYKEYALEGFNLDAVDYLLKPVSFDRFLKACNKAHERYNLQQKPLPKDTAPDYFFVYVEYAQVKISIPDILYIEGMGDYVKIHLSSSTKAIMTRMNLKALEEKLSAHRFIRTHKSYIVPVGKITAVKRDLVCIGNLELPVSDGYRANVDKALAT